MVEELDEYLKNPKGNVAYILFQIADRYLNGDGVKKDPVRAQLLFERAAGLGHSAATTSHNLIQSIRAKGRIEKVIGLEDGWADGIKLEHDDLLSCGAFGQGTENNSFVLLY